MSLVDYADRHPVVVAVAMLLGVFVFCAVVLRVEVRK